MTAAPETDTAATPELSPRDVRSRAEMTEAEMARLMDMSLFGYQNWEAGRRRPGGPARQLLKLIDADPARVKSVLTRVA